MQISREIADRYNCDAIFLPADVTDPDSLPSVQVAGVQVFVYVDPADGLCVSVHLDHAARGLTSPQETVPMRVTVQGEDVFTGN
jgi:hypothetical protein